MRLGGLILAAIFLPLPWLLAQLPWWAFWGGAIVLMLCAPVARLREILRALDQLHNAVLFGGSARESVSSHAWRDLPVTIDDKNYCSIWAWCVVKFTDLLQKGHCQEANRHEQPVVDFINQQ